EIDVSKCRAGFANGGDFSMGGDVGRRPHDVVGAGDKLAGFDNRCGKGSLPKPHAVAGFVDGEPHEIFVSHYSSSYPLNGLGGNAPKHEGNPIKLAFLRALLAKGHY